MPHFWTPAREFKLENSIVAGRHQSPWGGLQNSGDGQCSWCGAQPLNNFPTENIGRPHGQCWHLYILCNELTMNSCFQILFCGTLPDLLTHVLFANGDEPVKTLATFACFSSKTVWLLRAWQRSDSSPPHAASCPRNRQLGEEIEFHG